MFLNNVIFSADESLCLLCNLSPGCLQVVVHLLLSYAAEKGEHCLSISLFVIALGLPE